MIDKRLEGFLENIQQPDNKDVLDGIDSEKVAAWDKAVEDVKPFIKNIDNLNLWNKEFFIEITNKLK